MIVKMPLEIKTPFIYSSANQASASSLGLVTPISRGNIISFINSNRWDEWSKIQALV